MSRHGIAAGSAGGDVLIPPPPEVDFDRRWDRLLAVISEERGWTEPGEREYPESDDSNCWPMPYTPVEGVLPGTLREDILCGQVVVAEATWSFGLDDTLVALRIRSAAGWLPDLHVVGGRVEHMRDELLLPMTTIGDGVVPVPSWGRSTSRVVCL